MNKQEIEIEIRKTLARLTEQEVADIPIDRDLGESLGLDSLGRLELLSEVEDQFDLFFDDVDSEKASTIQGMLDIVETALSRKSEAA
jgi:acyl carrier protein